MRLFVLPLLALTAGAADYSVAREAGPPARLVLTGPDLMATVVPERGGELASLRVKHDGRWVELLWRALDYTPTTGWQGRAPLLWPATGRNFPQDMQPAGRDDGYWDFAGKRYPMAIHGFVRAMPWKVERTSAGASASAILSVTDTADTRRQYPFGFALEVEYRLAGKRLEVLHRVRAAKSNGTAMPMSIGNHITFRTPFLDGADVARMTLESPSTVELIKENNLPTGATQPRSYAKPVPVVDMPKPAALSLAGYAGEPYVVLRDGPLAVRIAHAAESVPKESYIQFNLWGDARAGYYSPEPWVGLQNSLNLNRGIVRVSPGGSWWWRYSVAVE